MGLLCIVSCNVPQIYFFLFFQNKQFFKKNYSSLYHHRTILDCHMSPWKGLLPELGAHSITNCLGSSSSTTYAFILFFQCLLASEEFGSHILMDLTLNLITKHGFRKKENFSTLLKFSCWWKIATAVVNSSYYARSCCLIQEGNVVWLREDLCECLRPG